MQFENNCTSNSQVIARGEAECNLTVTCTIILELHENVCGCLLIALHDTCTPTLTSGAPLISIWGTLEDLVHSVSLVLVAARSELS